MSRSLNSLSNLINDTVGQQSDISLSNLGGGGEAAISDFDIPPDWLEYDSSTLQASLSISPTEFGCLLATTAGSLATQLILPKQNLFTPYTTDDKLITYNSLVSWDGSIGITDWTPLLEGTCQLGFNLSTSFTDYFDNVTCSFLADLQVTS